MLTTRSGRLRLNAMALDREIYRVLLADFQDLFTAGS